MWIAPFGANTASCIFSFWYLWMPPCLVYVFCACFCVYTCWWSLDPRLTQFLMCRAGHMVSTLGYLCICECVPPSSFVVKTCNWRHNQFPPTRVYVYMCGCARGCRLILAQKCPQMESPSTGMNDPLDSYRSLCGPVLLVPREQISH